MSNHKHTQLFRFLKDYYQLKERSVYDVNNSNKYVSVLPLNLFSEVEATRSRLLGHPEDEDDRVLRLKRPGQAPEQPAEVELPDSLADWLEGPTNNYGVAPVLRQRIVREVQLEGEEDPGWWELIDFPGVEKQASQYLLDHGTWREKMRAWKIQFEAHQRHQRLYNRLFEAQRKMEIYAERFELLLGLGLVVWNDGKRVYRRPLVVVPLEATLTPSGTVELRLAAEADLFRVENDFLGGTELDATGATGALLKELEEEDGEFWVTYDNQLERALGAFAAKLSATARYMSEPPGQSLPTVPTIHHAPLIMLRERSQRSFTVLFEKILDELKENTDPQLRLLDRVVLPHNEFLDQYPEAETRELSLREEIFLPKESNEEQLKIADQIGWQDLLVVQGPPGTGKSHTIANVITHLLAQGKKVLVTAKTDQALKALQEHVPAAFHDLMIYFIQGADKSGQELVKSVSSLQALVETYDRSRLAKSAAAHLSELKELRKNRAALQNRINELRQADVRPADLNAAYKNMPLAEHVVSVLRDAPHFEWLQKENGAHLDDQLRAVAVLQEWLERFADEEVRQFQLGIRAILDVPLLPEPRSIMKLKASQSEYHLNFPAGTWTIDLSFPPEEIKRRLENFSSAPTLPGRLDWQRDLKRDLECGNVTGWQRRSATTKEFVEVLTRPEANSLYQEIEFDIPPGISAKKLRADVHVVGNYIKSGKALTGFMSKLQLTRTVKDRSYVYQGCTLNGHPATTAVALEKLYLHADICCALDELDAAWHKYPTESGRDSDKRLEYIDRFQQLQEVMTGYPVYITARTQVQEMVGRAVEELEAPDAAIHLRTAQQAYNAQKEISALTRELKMAESYLSRYAAKDQACGKLLEALRCGDAEAYSKGLDGFRELNAKSDLHQKLKSAQVLAERVFPETVAAWIANPGVTLPSPEEIKAAIYWRDASNQLVERLAENGDELFAKISRNDKRYREVALEYVHNRATTNFVEGLKNERAFNSTLVRWMQAAKNSSGRGKKAFKARIAAKEKLREISSDIPCWIMPLYRLADTLTPEPELFDVVIIDEASQLGPEATFLQYITKKIIVVGDDKQTAPEDVGVEEDKVQGLIRAHLGDIRDRQYYSTNYTFFDHASANAGQRITLREHFRCMPEIIGFSNELCYAPEGTSLIPLKQFRGDRLPPLQTQFVPEGSFFSDTNEPEAEAIVARIQAIIANPDYEGKTIGVVTLQGNRQHRLIQNLLGATTQDKGFKDRRLVVGKPADFQGDERDVILLSLVTAPNHRRISVSSANYERRYNVAMSRAKEQVILFHSVRLGDLKSTDLRYKLLHYFTKRSLGESLGVEVIPSGPRDVPPGKPFDSWFEVDVYRDLTNRGYVVQPQYPVGEYRIDLVVHLENGSRIAVECDGDYWHGPEHLEQDTNRQLQLERSGWEFYRIRYSQYQYDKDSALKRLWRLLEDRGKITGSVDTSTYKDHHMSVEGSEENISEGASENLSFNSEEITAVTSRDVDLAWRELTTTREQGHQVKDDEVLVINRLAANEGKNSARVSEINEEVRNSNPRGFDEAQVPKIRIAPSSQYDEPKYESIIFTSAAILVKFKPNTGYSLSDLLGEEREIYRISSIDPYKFIIFAYANGRVDKVRVSAFWANSRLLKNAYNTDSELIYIRGYSDDEDLAAITADNKVIVFNTSLLGLHTSRANKGNLVFKRGARMTEIKPVELTRINDVEFYRRGTLNVTGYYLKSNDVF